MSGPLQAATMASARGFEKSLYGRSAAWADKYAYCSGDPINASDPSGLQPPQVWARLLLFGGSLANEAYQHLSGNYDRADDPKNNRVTLPNGVTLWEGGTYQRVPVTVQVILAAPDAARAIGPQLGPGGAARTTTRVGRGMSQAEFDSMQQSGRVQAPFNGSGATHVTVPPAPAGFTPPRGSIFVECEVPNSQLRVHDPGNGWGRVYGPGSLEARLAAKRGQSVPTEMPEVINIKLRERMP